MTPPPSLKTAVRAAGGLTDFLEGYQEGGGMVPRLAFKTARRVAGWSCPLH